jgi:phenylalanyl-tRNA synthetase beta chain
MLVSLRWLARYLDIPAQADELATRLALSGLNHEETTEFNGDTIVDLEVTSNRGDCLGHLGIAREVAVLYAVDVRRPDPQPPVGKTRIESLLSVDNQFISACPRYTARVIQGVKVGPSPQWMVDDLKSVFWKRRVDGEIEPYKPINNVVDATNYVLMECGQPLHAFDYAKLSGNKIVIRPGAASSPGQSAGSQGKPSGSQGKPVETILAIDHKEYPIDSNTCVIADTQSPHAIAGVMGGKSSEVTESTIDVVIEAAVFTPLFVRRAARSLKLHSPSSFRFERKVDPAGVDWASRRVCELILQTAGGTLAAGVIDTAPTIETAPPIKITLGDIQRLLGISIDRETVHRILTALGCSATANDATSLTIVPPTWRHDLTRTVDLIEEVARIHGYDKIPENAPIPVAPSSRRIDDDATDKIRGVLVASGYSEAMTPSVVTEKLDQVLSPWTKLPPLQTQTPMLKGSRTLRRSLIPSLIESRALNRSAASIDADLFEIAHVYLPAPNSQSLPEERYSLGIVSGRDYFHVKGVIESLCHRLGIDAQIVVEVGSVDGFEAGTGVTLSVGGRSLGWLGKVDAKLQKQFKLVGAVVAAELSIPVLIELSKLVPQQKAVSEFPSICRDLNFIVDESIRWSQLESVARSWIGTTLADIQYRETYRDPDRDGAGRKRLLLTVELQKFDATLSGDEADELVRRLITNASKSLNAKLLD